VDIPTIFYIALMALLAGAYAVVRHLSSKSDEAALAKSEKEVAAMQERLEARFIEIHRQTPSVIAEVTTALAAVEARYAISELDSDRDDRFRATEPEVQIGQPLSEQLLPWAYDHSQNPSGLW